MFSLSRVVPELGFAFVAYVSLNGKLTELPFLIGFVNLILAVRTFSHNNQDSIKAFLNLRFFENGKRYFHSSSATCAS